MRIGFGWLALSMPTPLYGVLIKVGFTETLTIVTGLAFGPIQGFTVGALTIVVSDLYLMPGPWTPFVAAITGLLGLCAGIFRGHVSSLGVRSLGAVAVVLTLLNEFLQDIWFSAFFGIPMITTLLMGLPTAITAVINNTVLLTALGPRVIKLLREAAL